MRYGEQFGFRNRPRRGDFEPGIGGQGAYGRAWRGRSEERRYGAEFSGGAGGGYRGPYGEYGEFRQWQFGEGGRGDQRFGGQQSRGVGRGPRQFGRGVSEYYSGTYRGHGPIGQSPEQGGTIRRPAERAAAGRTRPRGGSRGRW